jgi:SAC3 family protein LENG8/THP3
MIRGKPAKGSKLGKLFESIEAKNAQFLATAAESSLAAQLAKIRANAALPAPSPPQGGASSLITRKSSASRLSCNGANNMPSPFDPAEMAKRAARRDRFLSEVVAEETTRQKAPTLVAARELHGDAAIGKSTDLEKEYLRLTSLPSVADIRPPQVLVQALELVKARWQQGASYRHVCELLKAIRLDLTVQHIENSLTVAVYETHVRVALEAGDWAEGRQCLAVLHRLYLRGQLARPEQQGRQDSKKDREIENKTKKKKKRRRKDACGKSLPELASSSCQNLDEVEGNAMTAHAGEFMGYALMLAAATGNEVFAHQLRACLALSVLHEGLDAHVTHALDACRAFTSGNYVGLLRLYARGPRSMAPYLLDLLQERLRPRAWSAMLSAYAPNSLSVADVAVWLGFENAQGAAEWLSERGGVITNEGLIDIKASREACKKLAE